MRIILTICWEPKKISEGGVGGGVGNDRKKLTEENFKVWLERKKKKRGRIGREKVRKWNRLKREQEEEEYIKERGGEAERERSKESEWDPHTHTQKPTHPEKNDKAVKRKRIWLAKTKETKKKKSLTFVALPHQ